MNPSSPSALALVGNPVLDAQSFPLYWPERWQRTKVPERTSRYKVSFVQARDHVLHELELLGATTRIISTNIPTRLDGLPRADVSPRDAGVAVYWTTRNGRNSVIACDRWATVRDNMRACGLALEGMRAVLRSGATQVAEKVYMGFAALPDNASGAWRAALGFRDQDKPNQTELRAAYELRVFKVHPDRGGKHEDMASLNAAYAQARAELGL